MVANLVSKRDPKIARNSRTSWENRDFPSPKLRFSSHKIRFSSTAFQIPRNLRKSSSTAFRFLQWLSAFFNGFLLSSMAFRFSSTAFHFPRNPGKSIYGGKYRIDCYPSFVFQPKLQYSAIKIIGGKNTKDHLSELRIFRSELRNSC
jgi:hypothetical protein